MLKALRTIYCRLGEWVQKKKKKPRAGKAQGVESKDAKDLSIVQKV